MSENFSFVRTLNILFRFCDKSSEAAPWADCEPISSWSNRHIKLIKEVSVNASSEIIAFKAVKLEYKLSNLGEEINSSKIPINDAGYF